MKKVRLLPCFVVAVLIGAVSFVFVASPGKGSAADPPPGAGTPIPVIPSPASNPPAIYETPIVSGTPISATGSQSLAVKVIDLGPGQGYERHDHRGASMLIVSSGQVCFAQRDNLNATVTIERLHPSTVTDPTACGVVSMQCDDVATGCSFNACEMRCLVNAGESFWLGPGDIVMQSSNTNHVFINVGSGDEHAIMLNTAIVLWGGEAGCAGDCF